MDLLLICLISGCRLINYKLIFYFYLSKERFFVDEISQANDLPHFQYLNSFLLITGFTHA